MVKKSIFSNPLVIDGSMSTSLERLGCDTDNELWTAAALINQPELVYQVHKEYFEAGARLAITDTYQANLPALKKAGLTEKQARQVIEKAVELAKQARDDYETETGAHGYVVTPAIKKLKEATALPIIVYPNSGASYDATTKTWSAAPAEDDFGKLTKEWLLAGASAIGGCCTTTPADIAKIAAVLNDQ